MAHPPSEEQRQTGHPAGAAPSRAGDEDGLAPETVAPPSGDSGPLATRTRSFVQNPFVFQHHHQLFLLDGTAGEWVLAELRFDLAICRYVEVRRASYQWPREALTVLLSRMVTGDPDDAALLDRATAGFAGWLSGQFQFSHLA
ncbi:MAG: hypothetical protein H0W53_18715 [Acidobacteria bacterium]|nr:hypothetical protein [Acidobacteriota bacterium]